jgi:receptor protein-tyrosine kinase
MRTGDLTDQTEFDRALRTIRRRWSLIVGCIVLAALAALGFSLVQQKQYTASASLLFRDTQFDQQLFGSNFVTPTNSDPAQQQATNVDLAALPVIATRTAHALGLTPALVKSEVSVSGTGQSTIAQISVTDPNPRRAARIANTYAQQYVLFRQHADRAKIAGAQQLVQQQLAKLTSEQRAGSVGQALVNRSNELGVLAALQTGNAEVVQTAPVPRSPSSPKVKLNGALGALTGLLLGLALAFLAERLDRRVRDLDELESAYNVPMLAEISESHALARERLASLPAPDLETFALLRARLRYFNVDRNIRSLLVTSAASGEGKSTVALNLALAECIAGNEKVLVLEADLRRPSLARRLRITSRPGLSEVITGSASLSESVTWVDVPRAGNGRGPDAGFAVLTSGGVPPNPAELLESRAVVESLNALMQRFDLVIIDSAPITVVSDAIPLVRLVGGVLVVARMKYSTKSALRHTAEQLDKLNAPVLGVVANVVRPSERAYYPGYGYGVSGNGRASREAPPEVRVPPVEEAFTSDAE